MKRALSMRHEVRADRWSNLGPSLHIHLVIDILEVRVLLSDCFLGDILGRGAVDGFVLTLTLVDYHIRRMGSRSAGTLGGSSGNGVEVRDGYFRAGRLLLDMTTLWLLLLL